MTTILGFNSPMYVTLHQHLQI